MIYLVDENLPPEYQNETDYRKIPREYLNPRIPQGRGMVKWAPMATLPQQFSEIDRFIEEQNRIDKPILSEDQINELNLMLNQKIHDNSESLIYYYEAGYITSIQGFITEVDTLEQFIQIKTPSQLFTINLKDIYSIK